MTQLRARKYALSPQRAGLISLWLASAMCLLPFLVTRHRLPLTSFHAEWLAAVLGLCAFGVFFAQQFGTSHGKSTVLRVPAITLAPLLLGLVVLLQFGAGLTNLPMATLHVCYLTWCCCLIGLGRSFRKVMDIARICTFFSSALLIAALCNAVAAFVPILGNAGSTISGHTPFFLGTPNEGFLAQANHAASLYWLGIASATYLRQRLQLGQIVYGCIILLLCLVSAQTGSRSVLLYGTALATIGLTFRAGPSIALGPILLQVFAIELLGAASQDVESAIVQVSGAARDIRLPLWTNALALIEASPWIGIGVGNYPAATVFQTFSNSQTLPIAAEHTHNLILQWAVEYGVPAATLAGAALTIFCWQDFSRTPAKRGHENAWCAGLLAVVGLHSLLEYPLWYAYFLGPTALVAGISSQSTLSVPLRGHRFFVAAIMLVAVLLLTGIRQDAITLESIAHRSDLPQSEQLSLTQSLEQLSRMADRSILGPYAESILVNSIAPEPQFAHTFWRICQRVLGHLPTMQTLENCAQAARLDGDEKTAIWLRSISVRAWGSRGRSTPPAVATRK